ncbi:hypothetical protein BDR22DRAFT_819984 [Usnea florida]
MSSDLQRGHAVPLRDRLCHCDPPQSSHPLAWRYWAEEQQLHSASYDTLYITVAQIQQREICQRQNDPNVSMIWGTFDDNMLGKEMLVDGTVVGNAIAASAAAWTNVLRPSPSKKAEAWDYQSNFSERPVTHAFIAMNEDIPPLLLHYFQTLLQFTSKSTLERNVTGLPMKSFEDSGLSLARTYAFNEHPEKPSFAMSFGNQGRNLSSPLSTLRVMLNQIPRLLYLRVGCRNIDSSFLASLPTQILTLDAAFADPDQRHLVTNLRIMRERCGKLFNLAIAVLPLHDSDTLSGAGNICFNRSSLSRDVLQLWEPFWHSLEHLKSTGVRVWEGRDPGFKRPRDTAV